jgi:hypothetical protein
MGTMERRGAVVSFLTEWPTITLLPGVACAAAIATGFDAVLRAEALE